MSRGRGWRDGAGVRRGRGPSIIRAVLLGRRRRRDCSRVVLLLSGRRWGDGPRRRWGDCAWLLLLLLLLLVCSRVRPSSRRRRCGRHSSRGVCLVCRLRLVRVCARVGAVSADVGVRRRCCWPLRGWTGRHGAQVGGRARSRGGRGAVAALGRVSLLHGREGLGRLLGQGSGALSQPLARGGGWVRGAGSRIGREGLAEHALLLLRHRLGLGLGLRAVLPRHRLGAAVAARAPRLVVVAEQLDKVAGEQPDHAPVALQPAHPPRAIAGVEHLDQVALYESEIALGLCRWCGRSGLLQANKARCVQTHLSSPRVHRLAPAREPRWQRLSRHVCCSQFSSPVPLPQQSCPRMRYGPRFTRRATATCVCLPASASSSPNPSRDALSTCEAVQKEKKTKSTKNGQVSDSVGGGDVWRKSTEYR